MEVHERFMYARLCVIQNKTKMSYDKCPFCEMGQAKRMLIWRLTKDLSRSSIKDLMKGKTVKTKNPTKYICPICDKNCGNAGLLAMHMKSPGRPYREIHRKYELEK